MPDTSWIAASLAVGSGVGAALAARRSRRRTRRLALTSIVLGAVAIAAVALDAVGAPARHSIFRSGVAAWLAGMLVAAWSGRKPGPS